MTKADFARTQIVHKDYNYFVHLLFLLEMASPEARRVSYGDCGQ